MSLMRNISRYMTRDINMDNQNNEIVEKHMLSKPFVYTHNRDVGLSCKHPDLR